jgi:hypothetical protein
MSDINKKSTPDQMRILMQRMVVNENSDWKSKDVIIPKKNMTMRDMLKITRNLNENELNKKTVYDQEQEEGKFLNNFNDINVNIKFIDLEIYDNFVFWGGTVDGMIQFVYKVTPDEASSGVEFNYLEDFSPDNPENEEIIARIEGYYDTFYKYWQENIIQK